MANPLWHDLAAAADLTLSPAQVEQLDAYITRLIEKNEVMNLTRITDRADAEIKHVADALTLLPYLPKAAGRRSLIQIADVGTGGGVPGAILAIARPDTIVTLIDATNKKLDAVADICQSVGVKNVRMIHSRAADVQLTFDVVTARAVAPIDTLLEWCAPLLKPASVLLAMKGPKAIEELEIAERRLRKLGLRTRVEPVRRPELSGHVIVLIGRQVEPARSSTN